MKRATLFFIHCLIFLCVAFSMTPKPAQGKRNVRKPSDSRVHLLHADRLYFNERIHPTAQFLVGDVRFEHEGTLMWCDSALFYEATNSFDAFGNVRMRQGDTLSLTGDILYYDGLDQMARVRHRVVLRHRDTYLYADSLDYDRMYDLGYFFEGGRLVDKQNELTSDWGEYSPSTREATFNYNVRLVNPRPPRDAKSVLISDTLHYNSRTGVAHVLGPSNIDNGSNHIYTVDGYYNSNTEESYVLDRSILQNGYKVMVGDSVCWNAKDSIGKAYGNVVYADTLNKNKFIGNYAMYNDRLGYAEAADSAVLIDYSQQDTAYVHADSFFLYTFHNNTDSVYRMLHAYHHVRAFRRDIQAVCDSLVYDGRDSCTTMYRDPIVWQEGQQLLGEQIKAWRNDSTLDSVYVINQALSVDCIDSTRYNQLACKEIHTYFNGKNPYLIVADMNVYANNFTFDDDSLLVGMNHIETSQLRIYLENRKIQRIVSPTTASGAMYNPLRIPFEVRYLENFAWFDYVRPLDKDDIFNWRPKQAGSELKQSVRHEAPRQSLDKLK